MSDSLIVEQSNKLIGQIVDDLEILKEEFLALNIEEILTKDSSLSGLTIMNLSNIKNHMQVSYIFLEAMRLAKEKGD